jgi:hypothetical protein
MSILTQKENVVAMINLYNWLYMPVKTHPGDASLATLSPASRKEGERKYNEIFPTLYATKSERGSPAEPGGVSGPLVSLNYALRSLYTGLITTKAPHIAGPFALDRFRENIVYFGKILAV